MKEDLQTSEDRAQPVRRSLSRWSLPALALLGLLWTIGIRTRAQPEGPASTPPEQTAGPPLSPPHRPLSSGSATRKPSLGAAACPQFKPANALGQVTSRHLTELSGLVASAKNPGVFFTHNDSGDEERAYALSETGTLLGTYRLGKRKRAIDIEDIAIASDGGQSWIYLADIGDNWGRRKDGVRVDRFLEPVIPETSSKESRDEQRVREFESATLHYPDEPQDAEAFLVDPRTGSLVIITKRLTDWARVFVRDSFSSGALRLVGELTPEATGHSIRYVTAADVSRDGQYVGVRTYTDAYLFRRAASQSLASALLGPACVVPTGNEGHGEALALVTSKASSVPSFITISEGRKPHLFVSEAISAGTQSK